MAKNVTELTVFVAGPSDVTDERERVRRAAEEVNRTLGDTTGFRLRCVFWEEDAMPGAGQPQDVVFDHLPPDNWDIWVGVLWTRFGTPTAHADSGTAEEFEKALELRRRSGRPRVALYFCRRPASCWTTEQAEQLRKVVAFREKVDREKRVLCVDWANPDLLT